MTKLQELIKRAKLENPKVWPAHWAGGSNSYQYDGRNTIWIDSERGEVARIRPDDGRVTPLTYARGELIVHALKMLPKLVAALETLANDWPADSRYRPVIDARAVLTEANMETPDAKS